MTAEIDIQGRTKKVLVIASNPATSPTTGWPIGFWWSELVHPHWRFIEAGYEVDVASPEGGALQADSWSDPRDESGYSAEDILSLGFISSPNHAKLIDNTIPLSNADLGSYDAALFVGGQGPMVTFVDNPVVHGAIRAFFEAGKPTAVICHATCALLKATKSDGSLIVDGKTWTGFANSEEAFADAFVGQPIQPFRIEDLAKRIPGTNFVVHGRFRSHSVRDGNLITGQQQYSGAAAADLVIDALGR